MKKAAKDFVSQTLYLHLQHVHWELCQVPGGTLIPLTVFGFLANILLFFPGGKVIDNNDHLSDEVWLLEEY